jgi:hypothetical protein
LSLGAGFDESKESKCRGGCRRREMKMLTHEGSPIELHEVLNSYQTGGYGKV